MLVPQQMKYLRINLTKYVQDLNEENYKSLMNKIKELNRKIFHIHGEEDWIFSRCQFFQIWPIDSMQSHSKSQ